MHIKINDRIIPNADWRVDGITGELRFETDEGVQAIADIYMPDQEVIIEERNDDDTLKAQWYMRKLISVTYKQNEDTLRWEVQAKFEMSANPISEIEDIRSNADDTDGGLLEIAEMASSLDEQFTDLNETFTEQQKVLTRLSGIYDTLADRVAELENRVGQLENK